MIYTTCKILDIGSGRAPCGASVVAAITAAIGFSAALSHRRCVCGGHSPGGKDWEGDSVRPCHWGGGRGDSGNNVSILHHVTLGGTGKVGGDRHPKIGDGVLIGAGATILGNIKIGEGAKVGAGSVVLIDSWEPGEVGWWEGEAL
ncbi:Putative serine acetyltransferase 5 [Glycine soja]|nr:Putative serine acetyltransferase 5 [Glycine soja]